MKPSIGGVYSNAVRDFNVEGIADRGKSRADVVLSR
jgi:hypothetical protein